MRRRWRLLTFIVLAACSSRAQQAPVRAPASVPARAPASVSAPAAPVPARCEPPPANASAPRGGFVFTRGYAALRLYRIDAKGCATFVTMVDTGGPLAFVSIGEAPPGEMPELTIDTWLMHGDRRRTVFAWVSGRYVDVGPGEEIRGPRRIR